MILVRVSQSKFGTFGVLIDGEIPFALTLERPWADNIPEQSAIPTGVYICQRIHSPKFGETFEITNVPDRTHVLFHKGNRVEDTQGCVLIGEEFAVQDDRPIIASSQRGYAEFMEKMKGREEFMLVVRGHDS